MHKIALWAALAVSLLCAPSFAQANDTSTDCSFDDGKQMSIRYTEVPSKSGVAKLGKVWTPGDKPITLFTQSATSIGDASVPAGAYRLYLIPNGEMWSLVVNKNVQDGAKYDQKQDVARVNMSAADLGHPVDALKLTFAKMGPQQCNLRVYYGKTGTYGAEFKEK